MKIPNEVLILGYGQEGKWWMRFFTELGVPTKTYEDPDDAWWYVPKAEVILVAVPISALDSVGEKLVRLARKDALTISACGLMQNLEEALAPFEGEIVFVHRLIGTHVKSMNGYSMAVNYHRLTVSHYWCEMLLRASGATIVPMGSAEHDDTVGFVQALIRVQSLAFGTLVLESGLPVEKFTNGPFLGMMSVLARVLDLGHLLSSDMVFYNRHSHKWAHRLVDLVIDFSHDQILFDEVQAKLANLLGDEKIKAGSKALSAITPWW